MMKKGFTLAEVLITLAIIGIVATMVLPGILTSTTEQQAKTAIKKAVNVLTNIAKMNEAIDGYDFASTTTDATGEDEQSVYAMISRRGDLDMQKIDQYTENGKGTGVDGEDSNYVIFFRDGAFISFPTGLTGTGVEQNEDGIKVLYDMNGVKSPNLLSNCNTPGNQTGTTVADDGGDCSKKENRFIKDRFSLVLKGSQVLPNGNAARWLYNN